MYQDIGESKLEGIGSLVQSAQTAEDYHFLTGQYALNVIAEIMKIINMLEEGK